MSRSDQIEGFCHGFVTVEGYLALSGGVLEFFKIRKWFRINRAISVGRLAQLVRAPALQVATSPLLLSLSPFFSIALHPFRDSAFAQHVTLFGCLTCISDTFLAQQEVPGSDCRGQMLCMKLASAGDCYSHSRGVHIERHRMLDDFVKKCLTEINPALPQHPLIGALGVPPKLPSISDP